MRRSVETALAAACIVLSVSCNRDGFIEEKTGGDDTRRPVTGTSSSTALKVFEYTPAPGQFIGDVILSGFDGSETTPEAACAYAERRLSERNYVSLGGFGGYIVVGFDHSINNDGGYNIAIEGNSMAGSSEPGIVWVMRDENGNGLPDDTWYELKGSEYGAEGTLSGYSVTYYRPENAKSPVRWTDSLGGEGEIDYIKAHSQESYYPAWIAADSYTLTGTRLAPKNYVDEETGNWVQPPYDWGYADNFSPVDRLTDDDNANADPSSNHFKISNAVTADGRAANLPYVDFVKVQTALNTKSGGLGENSTEVFSVSDFNMTKYSE